MNTLSHQIKKMKVGETLPVTVGNIKYNIVAILNNKYIFGASVGAESSEKTQKYSAPELFVVLRRLGLL